MKRIFLLLGVVAATWTGEAAAQLYRNEISVFGSYTRIHQSNQSDSVQVLNLGYGYYFTPQFVGTAQVARFNTSSFGYTDYSLGLKYYFGVGRRGGFVPFVDGSYGVESATNFHDTRWQFGGGGSWFVNESTSFDVTFRLYQTSTEPYITNGTLFGFGFTTRF